MGETIFYVVGGVQFEWDSDKALGEAVNEALRLIVKVSAKAVKKSGKSAKTG